MFNILRIRLVVNNKQKQTSVAHIMLVFKLQTIQRTVSYGLGVVPQPSLTAHGGDVSHT